MQNDEVKSTLALIRIIANGIHDFKGMTGHEDCDDCKHDCIHKALDIVDQITDNYRITKL